MFLQMLTNAQQIHITAAGVRTASTIKDLSHVLVLLDFQEMVFIVSVGVG